jgi:redox-regulated HSP33 family molecular chaperone
MIESLVLAAVGLMTQFLPLINSSSQVAKFIEMLIQILPAVEKLAEDLVQPIKNIINALSTNPATDADQLKALQDLDAAYDAAFEAAATAATAEDAANPPTS